MLGLLQMGMHPTLQRTYELASNFFTQSISKLKVIHEPSGDGEEAMVIVEKDEVLVDSFFN